MRTARLTWLTMAVTLLLATGASAQAPVAYITEIKGQKGEVLVQRAGAAQATAAQPLLGLRAGDQLRVTGGGRVALVFHGGGAATVTAAASPYTVRAVASAGPRPAEITSALTDFFIAKQSPPVFRGAVTRGMPPPTIVSPRHTRLFAGPPIFEWEGCDGRPCTIRVLEGAGLLWEQRDAAGSRATYPPTAPPLRRGVRYAWEVESPGLPTQRTEFEVMSDAEARRVRDALAAIDDLGRTGYSGGTLTVMRAGLLMDEGLFADARRELEAAEAIAPDDPTVPHILAHVYEHVGLAAKAREALARAQQRAP